MTFLMILFTVAVVFVVYVTCSVMATTSKTAEGKIRFTLAVAAVILIGGWSWFYSWKSSPQREIEAQVRDCGNTTLAFVMSQNFVKQRLKSPASANFPYVNDSGVDVFADGACGYSVSAYVDSQNGFGAMIRSSYQAKISYDRKTKLWSLGDLVIQ
ncbi:hypothetical protein HB13667_11655 [Pseudomonas putida]|uniref:Uncharacterized protein n=1 Tax=Pseudomonas putida TaxID=303 RepID=A0A0P7CTX9_PSEPU|nr:hypothetical protein [Pseudomonas putida]KPM65568.1 hypothetical protein HB13667_11655 [Pseudomonas putida]TXI02801.1 MAG: hypothetical protein E6Q70_17085 [Pseudomonas monteilii]